jgi:hypothetical protein
MCSDELDGVPAIHGCSGIHPRGAQQGDLGQPRRAQDDLGIVMAAIRHGISIGPNPKPPCFRFCKIPFANQTCWWESAMIC